MLHSLLKSDEFLTALEALASENERDEAAAIASLAELRPRSDLAGIRALILAERLAETSPALAAVVRRKAIIAILQWVITSRLDIPLADRIQEFADINSRIFDLLPDEAEGQERVIDALAELEATLSEDKPSSSEEAEYLLELVAAEIQDDDFSALPRHLNMIRNAREFYANLTH